MSLKGNEINDVVRGFRYEFTVVLPSTATYSTTSLVIAKPVSTVVHTISGTISGSIATFVLTPEQTTALALTEPYHTYSVSATRTSGGVVDIVIANGLLYALNQN